MKKELRVCDTCKEEGFTDTVTEYQCEVCGNDVCSFHAYPVTLGLTNPPLVVASIVVCDSCRQRVLMSSRTIQSTLSGSKKVTEEFKEAVKKSLGKEK